MLCCEWNSGSTWVWQGATLWMPTALGPGHNSGRKSGHATSPRANSSADPLKLYFKSEDGRRYCTVVTHRGNRQSVKPVGQQYAMGVLIGRTCGFYEIVFVNLFVFNVCPVRTRIFLRCGQAFQGETDFTQNKHLQAKNKNIHEFAKQTHVVKRHSHQRK